jgi:hypothetical protein
MLRGLAVAPAPQVTRGAVTRELRRKQHVGTRQHAVSCQARARGEARIDRESQNKWRGRGPSLQVERPTSVRPGSAIRGRSGFSPVIIRVREDRRARLGRISVLAITRWGSRWDNWAMAGPGFASHSLVGNPSINFISFAERSRISLIASSSFASSASSRFSMLD